MNKKEERFTQIVWEYYALHGRNNLPWRKTHKPYNILVSEIMLQQTQADRVVPKYKAFIKKFPTLVRLSEAPLSEVLIAWQGLGYNRRAKMLHACARAIMSEHKGVFPRTFQELTHLPGIGPYTASAVLAFAFNTPVTLIETNVRSVYLHHFFTETFEVTDELLLPLIERTASKDSPRDWYYALMDYGSFIKKAHGNPNQRSAHHVKQSAFKGSDREIRGALIRLLTKSAFTRSSLLRELRAFEDIRVDAQLQKLMGEGMIEKKARTYQLSS